MFIKLITINVICLDWSIFKYFKDMKSFLFWGSEIGFDIKTFAAIDFTAVCQKHLIGDDGDDLDAI